jgi:iron complex outermembrane receptor protein
VTQSRTASVSRLARALLTSCAAIATSVHAAETQAPAAAVTTAAASAATAAVEDEAIVVTGRATAASQVAASAVEFGNTVQIVGAPEIEASGATNFAEAVQFLVKGANIGYSPDEGEYTIRLDGGGDRDTLVVLDGVPLYDRGPTLETIWGSTIIDVHMIERIEVFRGGNSLFFGSNGGVGVVSIVTKRPDGEARREFGLSYGSFDTRELWGNVTIPLDAEGRHSVMFYGSYLHTDSPRIFAPESYVDNVAAGGGIQEFPVDKGNVGFKYLWKMADTTEFRLNGQYTEMDFHDPFPDTNTFSPNTVQYPIVDASLTHRWSDRVLTEVQGYFSNPQLFNTETFPEVCRTRTGCPSAVGGPATPFGRWTGRNIPFPNQGFGAESRLGGFKEFGGNFRNTFTVPEAIELVAGVQVTAYKDDSDPIFPVNDATTTITGLYADIRPTIPFSPDTAISLAVRTDFADAFGSKTIWKFGVRQPIGDFYLRANGGTSYSAPQNNELFANSPTLVGNPDLKTEETETYNAAAGVSTSIGQGVQLSAEFGGFHTDITNRIQSTSGLTPNTFFNNDRVTEIRGLMADLTVAVGEQLSANVSYTKQRARLDGSNLQINETPEYFILGNVTWRDPSSRFSLTLLPRYQGPEFSTGGVGGALRKNFGNYFVMNASAAYRLGDERQHRIQLRVVNIFDEEYAERYGFGNQRFSEAFVTGRIALNSPEYFYGYEFEGKPRSVYLTFSTSF